jgi:hypothetical protein
MSAWITACHLRLEPSYLTTARKRCLLLSETLDHLTEVTTSDPANWELDRVSDRQSAIVHGDTPIIGDLSRLQEPYHQR